MKIYYKDEYCTLVHGKCEDVMKELTEQNIKFDAIITDPPYNLTDLDFDKKID